MQRSCYILLFLTLLACNGERTKKKGPNNSSSSNGQARSIEYTSCDVDLRFRLNRNSFIQFYDSLGNRSWKWENDSVDVISCYFEANSSMDGLVRIDSVLILHGMSEDRSFAKEYASGNGNPILNELRGSWVRLEDCKTELSEWMLHGNYTDPYTPYIFDEPDTNSVKQRFDPRKGWSEHEVKILAVQGTWYHVELHLSDQVLKGWMPSYNLCSHPHTTCN